MPSYPNNSYQTPTWGLAFKCYVHMFEISPQIKKYLAFLAIWQVFHFLNFRFPYQHEKGGIGFAFLQRTMAYKR